MHIKDIYEIGTDLRIIIAPEAVEQSHGILPRTSSIRRANQVAVVQVSVFVSTTIPHCISTVP